MRAEQLSVSELIHQRIGTREASGNGGIRVRLGAEDGRGCSYRGKEEGRTESRHLNGVTRERATAREDREPVQG